MKSLLIMSLLLLAAVAREAAAQRNSESGLVNVSAKVGGKTYAAKGAGSCRHAPDASIYDVPAALWMIEYAGEGPKSLTRLNLTLWRPKDGSPEQISLSLETGSSAHRISSGGKAPPLGSGTIKLSPVGQGGSFELKGKDAGGTDVKLTVTCETFTGIEAEGG